MQTFILLTLGPVSEAFELPPTIHDEAKREGLELSDQVKYGKRHISFSSQRDGSYLEGHFIAEQNTFFNLGALVRAELPDVPLQVGCVIYGDHQTGVFFDNMQLRRMADLGMTLDIDVYDIAEDDEG